MRRPWKLAPSLEELFIERYDQLLAWSLQLTRHDREKAEDLLHDAFIQFTFTHPDIQAIHNLDNYLYGILRNIHVSQLRRAGQRHLQQLSIVEYDSAISGLRSIDPRDQIQVQDELRRICQYACARKETALAASVQDGFYERSHDDPTRPYSPGKLLKKFRRPSMNLSLSRASS